MKMIVAILPDTDNEAVSAKLIEHEFRVTTIASTGGFLSTGTSTLIIGVENDQVDAAVQIVKENCAPVPEPGLKRGSLFVINVTRFEQL